MDFSIIIPAYNEENYLSETLESCNQTLEELSGKFTGEIIVVDNNSTDNTAKIAKKKGSTVIFEGKNCIARARNKGAEVSKGDFLIFLDADTIAPTQLIETAIIAMKTQNICGGGCEVGFEDNCESRIAKILAFLWNKFIIKINPVAAGSFLFCLKKAWKECGGFDENFYASEEVHFSLALRRWAKKNNMRFKILPLKTKSSSRKFKTYSSSQIAKKIIPLIFFPWKLKDKRACSLWYERK